MSLTEVQRKLCNWIQDYIENNGYSPSIREMVVAMGLRSPAPIQSQLKQLRCKGYVDWQDGQSRTIKVLLDVNSKGKDVVLCERCKLLMQPHATVILVNTIAPQSPKLRST